MGLLSYIRISFGALAIAGAVFLAGCGGSEEPGVSAVSYTMPTVPVTPVIIGGANADDVATDALTTSVGAASVGVGGVGVAVSGGSSKTVKHHFDKAVSMANRILIEQRNAPTPAGASQVYNCDFAGTVTYTVEGYNERLDFNSCDFGDGFGGSGVVFNGSMATTNVSITGSPPTPPYGVSGTYSFNLTMTVGIDSINMMGSLVMAMSVNIANIMTTSVSGEMGITSGGASVVMTGINNTQGCNNWDNDFFKCDGIMTVSNNFTVGGTISNGTFTVTTFPELEIDLGLGRTYPYTGVIVVAGDTSNLRITINGDELGGTPQITVEIDANGDLVYDNGGASDPANQDYDWADLFP